MKGSPLVVILLTVFIDLIGFGIVVPVLPFYVQDPRFGGTPFSVGLLFASYSIMQLIFSPILGGLSDRYGRRPVLFTSILGTSVAFLIMGSAESLWMLFLGRILDGITGGNISTAQAYIADITTPENRAKGMGLVGAAFGLGFIFGPVIGGVLSQWSISLPFYFAAALALFNAILLYFTLPETVTAEHPARRRHSSIKLLRHLSNTKLSVVLIIYFLFVVSFSIMTTTFAIYTMFRFGYSATENGYLFAFVGIVAVIVQGGLIGRIVKRFGEIPLVMAGALLFALSLLALSYIGPGSGGLIALLAICGALSFGNSVATPSLASLASKSVGADEQGSVIGLSQSAASLSRVVGPLIGAYLINSETAPMHVDDQTVAATFSTGAAIMLAAFLLAVYYSRIFVNVPGSAVEAETQA
jgi:MFS transporter, DHA1 family, tetracycline resistance protein